MPFSTTYANNILNWAFGKSNNLAGHTKVFLGLCSNNPEADGGSFVELSGNGYGRVLLEQYGETYPALMTSASNRGIMNSKQIGFTKATGGAWTTAQGYGLFTQEQGGSPFFYAKLKNPVETPEGAVFLFDPNELRIDFQATDVEITE
jgi:hypothetical protein